MKNSSPRVSASVLRALNIEGAKSRLSEIDVLVHKLASFSSPEKASEVSECLSAVYRSIGGLEFLLGCL